MTSAESLTSAMSKAKIEPDNYEFIRRFTAEIGIAGYEAVIGSKSYVRATRRDGNADLHIHWGFTNGFLSEEEIVRVAGRGVVRRASSRKGTWYVEHPITRVHDAGERAKNVRREADFCSCGMQKSVRGECPTCD